jgi:hypothetical protein
MMQPACGRPRRSEACYPLVVYVQQLVVTPPHNYTQNSCVLPQLGFESTTETTLELGLGRPCWENIQAQEVHHD